ncbi:Uncharacterised protein [Clostridium tertium]|uniref:Uncharacterized protein n=1 Tax=Clostridium tertium TaxID=1559 RepID=A0A6N3FZ63_9CLOT
MNTLIYININECTKDEGGYNDSGYNKTASNYSE